mmetsp:Transcript_17568/g.46772  ORF Transcript_17568/g.46772 Transcript_17568/m.46772 type:complete len:189 (-) Transcript_17568:85-651(-)
MPAWKPTLRPQPTWPQMRHIHSDSVAPQEAHAEGSAVGSKEKRQTGQLAALYSARHLQCMEWAQRDVKMPTGAGSRRPRQTAQVKSSVCPLWRRRRRLPRRTLRVAAHPTRLALPKHELLHRQHAAAVRPQARKPPPLERLCKPPRLLATPKAQHRDIPVPHALVLKHPHALHALRHLPHEPTKIRRR